jgi:hypothetical protein
MRTVGQDFERAELVGARATISWVHRHWTPVRVSRSGCSCQCGRASAPMIPQFVHTIRGALAKELRIPVLALAQLNRAVEGRDNRRPELRDLRDSGSLEQDADAVIFAYRPEYYLEKPCDDPGDEALRKEALSKVRHSLELNIAKQRSGPTGTVHARFDAACNHLDNLAT